MAQIKREKTEILTVSLPKELTGQLKQYAREQEVSVSQLTRDVIKNYILEAKWRKASEIMAPIFKKLGIKTDDDVEKYFG